MKSARSGNQLVRATLAFVVVACAALAYTVAPRDYVFAADTELAAVYRDGALHVNVPYDERIARGRILRVEILDPTDKPVAIYAQPVSRAAAAWHVSIPVDKSIALEDLVWHRLRVGGSGDHARVVSLSEILRLPVVRVFAQRAYAAGSRASVRVIAVDAKSGDPLRDSHVKLDLVNADNAAPLFAGQTDALGTAQVEFTLPAGSYGARTLRVTADTPLGTVTAEQPVQVERRNKILLTTDKPLYQPGQTMHVRALALDGPTRAAAADQPLTIEVEDAKGNKVFKRHGRTDRFGIAAADFELADEINFGPYHVRAILGAGDALYTQEKTVTVDRYVLPKFKVEIELSRDAGRQQQNYYAPGETVEGKVTARYLFGKPLANAAVTVVLKSFDVEAAEIGRVTGKTDAEGRFAFSSKLPDFLAGRSTEQGSAPVSIGVEVKDTAEHTETKARDILVSNTPVLIMAVPESGQLLPGLDNRVFVLTSYPDGTPAQTTLTGDAVPASLQTDESGVATISVRPATAAPVVLNLKATDAEGHAAQASVKLESRAQAESLMLRSERAVYKVGDKLRLETISTRPRGAAYVDVVKDGQTLVTRAIETDDGRGRLDIDLTPEMFGTIEVRAYQFTADADPISDRRLVYVDPADDLNVEVSAGRDGYRPGEEARVEFRATDRAGRPVSAALGVEIVDEAVFALSDKQPGFEKVFMQLQKELLTPRYEVHQFSFEQVVLDDFQGAAATHADRRERAAEVLLAAAGGVSDRDVRAVYGREKLEAKRYQYAALYTQRLFERAQAIAAALNKFYEDNQPAKEGFGRDLQAFAASDQGALLRDPWGNTLAGEGTLGAGDYASFLLKSAGPDGRQGTADDINVPIYAQRQHPLEKTRQTVFKGQAAVEEMVVAGGRVVVAGVVKDERGKAVAGVKVSARRVSDGKTVWVYTDRLGRYVVTDLPPGQYRVTFESNTHHTTTYKTLALAAGARATVDPLLASRGPTGVVLNVYTNYGVAESVEVAAGAGGGDRLMRVRERGQMKAAARPTAVFMDGMNAGAKDAPLMLPMAAPVRNAPADDEISKSKTVQNEAGGGGGAAPRVRSFFPETLYTNPALITDGDGRAAVSVPLADSITTWRVTSLASTTGGALGSATAPLRVFQDFFIDLDLPVSITEGDAVSVPVAVYNYLPAARRVALELRTDPWFALQDGDVAAKQVEVGSGEVSVAYFRLKATQIGEQQLQVTARLEGGGGDAVARNVTVAPNGEERAVVVNERLEGAATKDVVLPADAIADASHIFVKFYPGALAQTVEGLDSILRMPGGCFEQTSSSTYPNVLVLDYLKASKKLTPEIQAKAEGYISLGYQRLVTFEVRGGGFSWFGEAPANKILTAYGLMEFSDMARVHEVDPRLIERTQAWLAAQQQPDGSFKPDTSFINEGATTRYNTDVLRITAYIGWSLAATGYKGEAVERARRYVSAHATGREDAYTLAVIANFAADSGLDKSWTDAAVNALAAKASEGGKTAFWNQDGETPTSAREDSADLETTALAVQALLKSGQRGGLAKKGLDYLTEKKDALGNWQTTQATILALKAFLLSYTKGTNADTEGTISVAADGRPVANVQITRDNNDLLHLVDLKPYTHAGAHRIALSFAGRGQLQYQIVARYYVPWARRPDEGQRDPLAIALAYDRTRLAQDETVTARVRVQNNTAAKAKMIMVDLGIPPGFEPAGEDFAELVSTTRGQAGGRLEKYTLTAKQVILYFDGLNPKQKVEFAFRLRAKFPVRAQTFASRVYEYYNPAVEAKAKPQVLTVTAK